MRQSLERILVSHAGALPAPDDLMALVEQAPTDADALRRRLPSAVLEVVKRQVDLGVDVVNDGELSKRASRGGGFTYYAMRRLDGLREEPDPGGKVAASRSITARDARSFPGFHAQRVAGFSAASAARAGRASNVMVCAGPLRYIGQAQITADIANLKAALEGRDVEGYLPAVAPGTIEHWLWNEHYRDDEELLYAVAEAMSEEYEAITAAEWADRLGTIPYEILCGIGPRVPRVPLGMAGASRR
jgi:5-methyltetrahydropteroyltriglutamate--homocysteine methyltransferase